MLISSTILAVSAWDAAVSAGAFATVFLLVYGIFSQPGQIEMSAQRQAAIATGHTDRRTIFENPILRPVLWLMLLITHRLNVPSLKRWVRNKLVAAGSPKYYTAEEYLALSLFSGLTAGLVLETLAFLATSQITGLLLAMGLVIGTALSLVQLSVQASNRIRDIQRQLPYSLDLISLAMGAGATFVEAAQTVTRQGGDDPFTVELRAMLAEMDLGTTRRRALENLSRRVPLDSLRSIIASILQAEELGTPLQQVLAEQASMLRRLRSMRAEELAAKASVRILVPCLLLVLAVMLTFFGPVIVRAVRGGMF